MVASRKVNEIFKNAFPIAATACIFATDKFNDDVISILTTIGALCFSIDKMRKIERFLRKSLRFLQWLCSLVFSFSPSLSEQMKSLRDSNLNHHKKRGWKGWKWWKRWEGWNYMLGSVDCWNILYALILLYVYFNLLIISLSLIMLFQQPTSHSSRPSSILPPPFSHVAHVLIAVEK